MQDIKNALTVDVEDYFQVSAFAESIDRSNWDGYELRVEANTLRVLDLFDRYEVKATFFTLGWIAERVPGLVREISERGHEVACHGYGHQLVYDIGPKAFQEDIHRSKGILEDITGKAVIGYRAPSYTITERSLWALDILIEEGFRFDSSIFPIYHDRYGIPNAQRFPHMLDREGGSIAEFPLTTRKFSLFGKSVELPVAGGGYLRLLPIGLIRNSLQRVNTVEGQPVVLYFHPWEIDPGQPRVGNLSLKSRFRHYVNLSKTYGKLEVLLKTLSFDSMGAVLAKSGLL